MRWRRRAPRASAQFVLLSAICVQKPLLAFQHAKLAFEQQLVESGLAYCIVRPTAYFKSLSGQVERVKQGKPFLVFGDGTLTACKPISDDDLGDYLADCLDDASRHNRVLPIGGPGPAITPRQQGEHLLRAARTTAALQARAGRPAGRSSSPPWAPRAGWFRRSRGRPSWRASGATTRPSRCWCWTPRPGATTPTRRPSTGTETLFDYYAELVSGAKAAERGDHAVF